MRKMKDFYPDLIERVAQINRRRVVRVNLSDRYKWSEIYARRKVLRLGEMPEEGKNPR